MLTRKIVGYVFIVAAVTIVSGFYFLSEYHASAGAKLIYIEERVPTVYLLAVGSNEMTGMGKLKNAESDAAAVSAELEKRLSYRINEGENAGKSKIKTTLLTGSAVTRDAIIAALDSAAREIDSNDIFIFHFAGAGSQISDGDFYLALPTFDHGSKTSFASQLETNAVRGEVLKSYFARIRAKTKVLLFDTGISDFVYDQDGSFFSQRRSNSLFIGTQNLSYDVVKDKNHGTVTGVLLDALRGGADFNYDGKITAWETLAYFGNVKYDAKRHKQTERDVKFCTTTQGTDFDLTLTDSKLDETLARLQPAKASDPKTVATNRAEAFVSPSEAAPTKKREGSDYAVLFAFDQFDTRWTPLANPQNDANDIARELGDRYKFKQVEIKKNLTIAEFEAFLDEYKKRKFNVDDQIFFFIAGHGTANEYNNGFLIAKDSPAVLDKRSKGYFISLDEMLAEIDLIQAKHIMVVFDACFAGRMWRPAFTLVKSDLVSNSFERRSRSSIPGVYSFVPASYRSSNQDDKLSKDEMISRELSDRSRVILTSGWDVVSDGKPGTNSPFAKQFVAALRKGADENGLITLTDIMSYVKRVKNKTPPELGRIDKLGEKNTGGFVFCQGGCSPQPTGPR